jgi:AbrB family looped-hinge helix DNA binding protein
MKMSPKGVVTIPKRLREQYQLEAGTEVELIDTDAGLILRRKPATEDRTEETVPACRRGKVG